MAGNMGCKNRLVIVKEKLELERCTVYGLDNDEREEFYQLLCVDEFTRLLPSCAKRIVLDQQRASKLIPVLEKMNYVFYNVSDNADTITDWKVEVTWRFMKKI